jgi:glycosyltransferase involved in cell wall biosynthesis
MHNVVRGDGQGRVGYEIARYGLRQGHEVTVLADRVDEDLIAAGAHWKPIHPPLPKPMLAKVVSYVKTVNRALDALAGRFDVVHGIGYTLTRPHEVNSAQFVHGAWLRSPLHIARNRRDPWALYQRLYSAQNARWEAESYRQAKMVVACSRRVRDELISCGVAASRTQVIYNAVDPEEFTPGRADRAALQLPANVPLGLFVGDIRTERKNLGTVLHALASTAGIHLAVVGSLAESPFPDMARRLGLAERVHFLGYRRDVARLMQAVDVYIFPSRYEPFGIVVLEALASGTPVITACTVGAAEIVTPECGIVLPDPNDAHTLGAELAALMGDPARRACMARAARDVAMQHGWQRMAQEYFRLYESTAL